MAWLISGKEKSLKLALLSLKLPDIIKDCLKTSADFVFQEDTEKSIISIGYYVFYQLFTKTTNIYGNVFKDFFVALFGKNEFSNETKYNMITNLICYETVFSDIDREYLYHFLKKLIFLFLILILIITLILILVSILILI